MNVLNAILVKLTGLLLAPFATLPSQVALVVIAAVAGVLAAVAFRYTSNQQALRRVADQIRANLLAMRLFKDDLRSVLGAQAGLLKASVLRLWYSLPPLAVLIVPFVLLLAQLSLWYEYEPLAPGDQAIVEVHVAPDAWAEYSGLELLAPDGIDVAGPVRAVAAAGNSPRLNVISWRLEPQTVPAGEEPLRLRLRLGDQVVAEKQLVVRNDHGANRLAFVSPLRPGPSFWDRLLYPGEPAFPADSPIQKIAISYRARANTLFGLRIHWVITFFVVSILAALAVKPLVKVQF